MSTTMLYKAPGPHDIHGGKFDYRIVDDADIEAAMADGWHLTTPEALAASVKTKAYADGSTATGVAPLPDESPTAPPTRAELEQKAGELGITFDKRLGDKKLAALIADKLKG